MCLCRGGYQALPYLRKEFTLAKPIAKARLYTTALGVSEVHLNGRKVGEQFLAPGWTDYNKRVRYQVYDVTTQVKQGANALGALVGNGWYCGHTGNGGFRVYGIVPELLAQLEVTYTDGTTERIITDDSWKTRLSPILASDFGGRKL